MFRSSGLALQSPIIIEHRPTPVTSPLWIPGAGACAVVRWRAGRHDARGDLEISTLRRAGVLVEEVVRVAQRLGRATSRCAAIVAPPVQKVIEPLLQAWSWLMIVVGLTALGAGLGAAAWFGIGGVAGGLLAVLLVGLGACAGFTTAQYARRRGQLIEFAHGLLPSDRTPQSGAPRSSDPTRQGEP